MDGRPDRQWIRWHLGALVLAATLAAPVGAAGGDPAIAGAAGCRAIAPIPAASVPVGGSRACTSRLAARPVPPSLPTVIEVSCASDCELRAATVAALAAARAAGVAASAAATASRSERADELRRLQLAAREQHALWSRGLALVLGFGALLAGVLAGAQAGRKDGVRFSRHWGGFGGADGGWRMSSALTNLLICALLAGAAVLLMLQAAPETTSPPAPTGEAATKGIGGRDAGPT